MTSEVGCELFSTLPRRLSVGYRPLIEDGAYLKLLLDYYVTVQPLPADWKDLYIIACAITAAEKGLQFGVIQSLAG
ncbi:hypothetical protein RAC83_001351 [Xylella fastidiosa]|nr:hypothetical protein [Xylella fastidiosa]